MSLFIDSRKIVGVYALGQWFNIKPDTFVHDSFELICWEEDVPFGNEESNPIKLSGPRQPHSTCFAMGALYADKGRPAFAGDIGNSRMKFAVPSGYNGVQFIDADSGLHVSMSLMEIKAFRELPIKEAEKACAHLRPKNEDI